jgi:hypothetical protein
MLAVDIELFYLLRPLLVALFGILAVAAIANLFRERLEWMLHLVWRRQVIDEHSGNNASNETSPEASRSKWLPYLILGASGMLGVAIALYPYSVAQVSRTLGSDSWFYLQYLLDMRRLSGIMSILNFTLPLDRGFFFVLLYLIVVVTGIGPDWVVRLIPALLSVLLAVSTFILVKEGTGRPWVAAFASVLSVVSAQTSLGMSAGIFANWFGLPLANFMLALVVRSIRIRSTLMAVGAVAVSIFLLWSYAYVWVFALAELLLAAFAVVISLRAMKSSEWKNELARLGVVILGGTLIPIALLVVVAMPLLGYQPQGLDPLHWMTVGWYYLSEQTASGAFIASVGALEQAFDFAGNRIDLPFLTLLSIVGMLDRVCRTRPFGRMVAVMVLVPLAITLISPGLFETWRGLYVIPLYLTGALGAASIIKRVNGEGSLWTSRSRLAFAGAFIAYIFLSQLSYSLRALDLLILAGR